MVQIGSRSEVESVQRIKKSEGPVFATSRGLGGWKQRLK